MCFLNNVNVYKKVSHIETDKNKLVLFLFEELLKSLHMLKKHVAQDEIELKVNKINHCLDIFEELKISIVVKENDKDSLEMGYYLEGIYNQQIINLYEVSKGSIDKLEEIINVTKGMTDVWNIIMKT